MNTINKLFTEKKNNILSIYFTAGFPKVDDTGRILNELVSNRVDMIEIGIPFSDPLADGPVIQASSEEALKNGMTLKLLFEQLEKAACIKQNPQIAFLLMGYLNPILQFGVERFCLRAAQVGISGCIIPDLPMDEYLKDYKTLFNKYDLKNIFLITPQTPDSRIRLIDNSSDGFIYMVSSDSTTGTKYGVDEEKEKYFKRIKSMQLKNPLMIGFGISDKNSFSKATQYANGAIIGSAFINNLKEGRSVREIIGSFKDKAVV